MNIVFEGTNDDGTRTLIPPSLIRRIAVEAEEASYGNKRKAMRYFTQNLCLMMTCRKINILTEIKYWHDGSQVRTIVARKA